MADVYVDQLMSRPVETVTPATTIADAVTVLVQNHVGAAVVVDDRGRLEGVLSATDVARLVGEEAASETIVAEVMRTDVVTTTRETPVHEVASTMIDDLIHHVPVVEGDAVVGIITTLDLTAHLARSP